MKASGKAVLQQFDKLHSDLGVWSSFWQDISNYILPRKAHITEKYLSPDTSQTSRVYDTTAQRACMTLASGQLSLMTPMESKWFSFGPPKGAAAEDEVSGWFNEVTQVVQEGLQASNFYSEIHEFFLDRAAFGTACIYAEVGRNSLYHFKVHDIGTYCIAENEEETVDSVFREIKMTLKQAVQEFGLDALSDRLKKDWEEAQKNPANLYADVTFIHGVFPRDPEDRDVTKEDGPNKEYASVWVERATDHVAREAGFDEFPFMVSRYLRWDRDAGPYGWSPSWTALPEARQLNFLSQQLDALAELKAFPRFLHPDNLAGEVDLRSGGVTVYDSSNPEAKPQEWATAGDYPLAEHRHEIREKAINDAYHVDLFKMFANLDKQMTAREVSERKSEKLIQFSPTFDRIKTEVLNPLLTRLFAIGMRRQAFPPPPQDLIQLSPEGAFIPDPDITYLSKIALAMEEAQQSEFFQMQEMFGAFYEVKPELLDNLNLDQVMRDTARARGLPEDWVTSEQDVAAARQARAEAAANQAMVDQAEQVASAAGNAPICII